MILYANEELPEVEVTGKAPEGLKYMDEYRAANPMQPYKGNTYLKRFKPEQYATLVRNHEEDYNKRVRKYAENELRVEKATIEAEERYKKKSAEDKEYWSKEEADELPWWEKKTSGMEQTPETSQWSREAQKDRQIDWGSKSPLEQAAFYGTEAVLGLAPELAMLKYAKMTRPAWKGIQYADDVDPYGIGNVFSKELAHTEVPSHFPTHISDPANKLVLSTTKTGGPLEGQVNKHGYISRKAIEQYFKHPNTPDSDKAIISNLLNTKFAGQSKINYKKLQGAVTEELIPVKRVSSTIYDDEGIDRLGYDTPDQISIDLNKRKIRAAQREVSSQKRIVSDIETSIQESENGKWKHLLIEKLEEEKVILDRRVQEAADAAAVKVESEILSNQTITYANPDRFGEGSTEHGFPKGTVGHSRYFVTKEDPETYHILETQSDYFQKKFAKGKTHDVESLREYKDYVKENEEILKDITPAPGGLDNTGKQLYQNSKGEIFSTDKYRALSETWQDIVRNYKKQLGLQEETWGQQEMFAKNFRQRLLQEAVQDAADAGMSTVRVPANRTAAKIQNYKEEIRKKEFPKSDLDPHSPELNRIRAMKKMLEYNKRHRTGETGFNENFIEQLRLKDIETETRIRNAYDKLSKEDALTQKISGDKQVWYPQKFAQYSIPQYSETHKKILQKYGALPALIKKTFGIKPKVVRDVKGNYWNEFPVPDTYKKKVGEIIGFKSGGILY